MSDYLRTLKQAIAKAVAVLDEADGSRSGLQHGYDKAREVLAEAYGSGFETSVADAIRNRAADSDIQRKLIDTAFPDNDVYSEGYRDGAMTFHLTELIRLFTEAKEGVPR